MRVFVAGATGVLGRAAVRALVEAEHRVTGVARTERKAELVREIGAEPIPLNVFDPKAVVSSVEGHEVVCNFATKIPLRTAVIPRAWATNNRLHREASQNLVDGALATGASRYLQHSIGF